MNITELLQQLETMTHGARMLRMYQLGKMAVEDVTIAKLIESLWQGNFYERFLAIQSCYGSGNGSIALQGLQDSSSLIRSKAIRLIPLIGSDTEVKTALATASLQQRRAIIAKLVKRRRQNLVDEFFDSLDTSQDERSIRLLPLANGETVTRHLNKLIDRAGSDDWYRLSRHHPDLVAEVIQKKAEAATDLDNQLIYRANIVLPKLAELRFEKALHLVKTLLHHAPLFRLDLQDLVDRCPTEIADLILKAKTRVNVNFNHVADKLKTEQIVKLLKKHNCFSYPQKFLKKLKPEQREIIYNEVNLSWRDSEGKLDPEIIKLLPQSLRLKEAKYHLDLPVLSTRPSQRLPYATFLAWEEAFLVLQTFIENPDPDLRIAALSALVGVVRYQRDCISVLLELIKARRNEQDPVRMAIVRGLANLPPSIWRLQHLNSLSQIIEDALNAADLSHGTASSIEYLICAILPFHPGWSADWLAKLVKNRGQLHCYNLGDRLANADIVRIAPILLPVLKAWEIRERQTHLLTIARSLGRRLQVFNELVNILERILKTTRDSWIASSILSIFAEYRGDRLKYLIPELIAQDPSYITQPIVYSYLHRHRQDLLTQFLGQRAYTGRFSTGKTRFVPYFGKGFHRWNVRQQEIFADTLEDIIRDNMRDFPAINRAIEQLSALPAVYPKVLIQLASHLNPNLAIRDLALCALSRLDAEEGLPTLLESFDDDRARIAIYALRRRLLPMPSDRVLAILRQVPLEKVTVAKEVVRLIGELPSEVAYPELIAWDAKNLHRDVRVSLLRALWEHLEREETWSILEGAAISDDEAIAIMAGRTPNTRLSLRSEQKLVELIVTILNHPNALVRYNVLLRCHQLPKARSRFVSQIISCDEFIYSR
jgi:HEAT repeat protein